MELHPSYPFLAMTQTHDYPVTRFRRNFQTRRQTFTFDNQRVITPCLERRVETFEDRRAVMFDFRGFAVHNRRRAHDTAAEHFTDGLMSQADSKDRHSSGKASDQFRRD